MVILSAASAFAQGTMVFDTHVTGLIIAHVYAPLSSSPGFYQTGSGSADTPTGTQDWTGFTLIGANGTNGRYGAATTFAQLLGATGYNQHEASLQPAVPATTFRTGTTAGNVWAVAPTFANIPFNTPESTIEMVAWDNSSGLYSTWAQAFPAWQAGLIAAGESGPWNQDNIGTQGPGPYPINSQDPSQHVSSFNLYFTPEPSEWALTGLGASLLLVRRCRSKGAG